MHQKSDKKCDAL